MEREILFRAWDKATKKLTRNFSITGYGVLKHGDGEFMHGNRVRSLQIMQYIGIKDRNGKRIHEGDIVKINDDGDWHHDEFSFGVVKRGYGCFEFVNIENNEDTCEVGHFAYLGDGTSRPHDHSCHPLFEVIGNIYENPELLK